MWCCQQSCVCLFVRAGLAVECGVRLGAVQMEGRGERVRWRNAGAAHGGGGGGGGGVCDVEPGACGTEAEWRGGKRKQSRNAVETCEALLSQSHSRGRRKMEGAMTRDQCEREGNVVG